MRSGHVREWLVVWACILCLMLAACSQTATDSGDVQKGGPAAPSKTQSAEGDRPDAPRKAARRRQAAKKAREHPFLAVVDLSARRKRVLGATGPMVLKAIVRDTKPAAIIQEGHSTHFVREGEWMGAAQILTIREDEVVIRVGARQQILALYER